MKTTPVFQLVFGLFLGVSGLKMVMKSDPENPYGPKTDDYVSELSTCYSEEDKRLARQREEAGIFGFFNDLVGGACGVGDAGFVDKKEQGPGLIDIHGDSDDSDQPGLIQVEDAQSLNASLNPFLIGCAVVQGGMGIAEGFISREHDRQNTEATDCNRLAAMATQKKLASIEGKVDNITKDLKAMSDKMDRNHQEIAKSLGHFAKVQKANQLKVQQMIQSEVATEMNVLGQGQGLLAAKLDDVLEKITDSMEMTELASYKGLYARFSAAMAVVRGAHADILATEQDKRRHDAALPAVKLDKNTPLKLTELAMQEWQETSVQLSEKIGRVTESSWRQARNAFAEVAAVLVQGDLLFMHFQVQLRSRAANFIGKTNSQLEDLFHKSDLHKELQTAISEDALMPVILTGLMSTLSIMEMYLAVYPNYEDVLELVQAIRSTSQHLQAMQDRLGSLHFLASVVESPILKKFEIKQECLRAAFKGGYTNTDAMSLWKEEKNGDWIGVVNPLIRGQTAGAFYYCAKRDDYVNSGFTDKTFASKTKWGCFQGEHKQGRYGDLPDDCWEKCFKLRCDEKDVKITVQCPDDYHFPAMKVKDATFLCSSKAAFQQIKEAGVWMGPGSGGGTSTRGAYMVTWTCKNELNDKVTALSDMKRCKLMDEAPTKTFKPASKKLPYEPKESILVASEGHFHQLAKFATKVSDRTVHVMNNGIACNNIHIWHGVGVYIGYKFLQIGGFRFRDDGWHLWMDAWQNRVTEIWRGDWTLHPGGRERKWKGWRELGGMALKSLDQDTSKYKVYIGDRFIQIGSWRLADIDGEHFSVSWSSTKKRVIQIFQSDGRNVLKTSASRYHAWDRSDGPARGVTFGNQFIQIGNFRLGVVNRNRLTLSHIKTGKTAMIWRSWDGKRDAGPRTDFNALNRPACFAPKQTI